MEQIVETTKNFTPEMDEVITSNIKEDATVQDPRGNTPLTPEQLAELEKKMEEIAKKIPSPLN